MEIDPWENTFVIEASTYVSKSRRRHHRIDDPKYVELFRKVKLAIETINPKANILLNLVPKDWADQEAYCQLVPNKDPTNLYYEIEPRHYAFEVSFKGIVISSKLRSM